MQGPGFAYTGRSVDALQRICETWGKGKLSGKGRVLSEPGEDEGTRQAPIRRGATVLRGVCSFILS
jgi:hypothetical protein